MLLQMPDYVHDNALGEAAGMVLMGSFLTRKWKTGTTDEGRPQVLLWGGGGSAVTIMY